MRSLIMMSFKPCYKWNTFNTDEENIYETKKEVKVLNLVISGIPSIQKMRNGYEFNNVSFKPCYKWNTFNTRIPDMINLPASAF